MVRKWVNGLFGGKESLKEISYENNVIVSVNDWKPESRLAFTNE